MPATLHASFDLSQLTGREREVLEHLLRGKQNRAIAVQLGIDVMTVKTFVSNILRKFHVETRTELILALHCARGPQNRVAAA